MQPSKEHQQRIDDLSLADEIAEARRAEREREETEMRGANRHARRAAASDARKAQRSKP